LLYVADNWTDNSVNSLLIKYFLSYHVNCH
jgi:hypothetical protein